MPDTDREIRKEYMKNYYKRKKKLNRFIVLKNLKMFIIISLL